jgi:hypothetical protein
LIFKYQIPCYGQLSAFYENIATNPKDYKKTILYCKQILNTELRMACVKFFAGRASRSAQYEDVRGLCVHGTSTYDERIMCTAAFGSRIARSLDPKKSKTYEAIVKDVCKHLPFYEVNACINLGVYEKEKIHFNPEITGVM